jgi:hypothetical protein
LDKNYRKGDRHKWKESSTLAINFLINDYESEGWHMRKRLLKALRDSIVSSLLALLIAQIIVLPFGYHIDWFFIVTYPVVFIGIELFQAWREEKN